jgi:photosystem II stability/assembly factor-like uncharacterized protein
MNARRIAIVVLTIILVTAVLTGAVNAFGSAPAATRAELANVRDYQAAPTGRSYAVDGGALFAGNPGAWVQVATPAEVIVGAVAANATDTNLVYIGAANELAIYRSTDAGENWQRIALTDEYVGGVTDIAVDGAQHLVYVGTDTAGVFRLRDVGSSMVLGGQLLLDEPVLQVAADSTGKGLAFVRTQWNLYRAENFGLAWVKVENLKSAPTAVAVANSDPAKVYVGTVDRGLLASEDGREWTLANEGLGLNPGTRLTINALSIDPAQPEVIYVATSYLHGTTAVAAPVGVSVSNNAAQAWTPVAGAEQLAVAELLPVSGVTGAVFALTTDSRTPLALGDAPVLAAAAAPAVPAEPGLDSTAVLAWVIAGLAAIALVYAVAADLRSRRPAVATSGRLAPSTVRNDR